MARYGQSFSILSLIFLISRVLGATPCYGADPKHTLQNQNYTPCNQSTRYSVCIRNQVDANGNRPDQSCLPNGLILAVDGSFWREGCTDPSWTSEYCLNSFNSCVNDANGNTPVTPCSGYSNSTTWCCGFANTACCGQSSAITIAATLGSSNTTSTSPSTVSSTGISSTASVRSPTSTSGSMALSTGPQARIGVGASLVIAILACII